MHFCLWADINVVDTVVPVSDFRIFGGFFVVPL